MSQTSESNSSQSIESQFISELIYELDDRPPPFKAVLAAIQHILAIFVSIVTPPLIICGAIGLDIRNTGYVVSMSLVASGISTFIHARRRTGPIGSGLLSISGTSTAFIAPIIGAGMLAINDGGTPEQAMALLMGVCIAGGILEMGISRIFHLARKVFTPLVTGTVVTLIGMTLVRVGMTNMGGGFAALGTDSFGNMQSLLLAFITLGSIIFFNCSKNDYIRMGSIAMGMVVGFVVCLFMGIVDFSPMAEQDIFAVPNPLRFGLDFSIAAFIPLAFAYATSAVETVGDLTATSAVSKQPVDGPVYISRIKSGVLGDGFNSTLAGVFGSFPQTTFSQNNGIIQLTGVASRHIGYYVAGILTLVGLFPVIGGAFMVIPAPVLGGATLIMFGTIATSGIRILASEKLDRRGVVILATSMGMGLGVTYVPQILQNLDPVVQTVLAPGYTTGGIVAIILNLLIPASGQSEEAKDTVVDKTQPQSS